LLVLNQLGGGKALGRDKRRRRRFSHAPLRDPGTRSPAFALGPHAGVRGRATLLASGVAAAVRHLGASRVDWRPPPRLPRLRGSGQRRPWRRHTLGRRRSFLGRIEGGSNCGEFARNSMPRTGRSRTERIRRMVFLVADYHAVTTDWQAPERRG